jgi:glycosidase
MMGLDFNTTPTIVFPVASPAQINAFAAATNSPIRWDASSPSQLTWALDTATTYVAPTPAGFSLQAEATRLIHGANDRIVYQVVTDRFLGTDGKPVRTRRDYRTHFGGNFAGVEAALPYLGRLGVTAVWLSPVQSCPDGRSGKEHMEAYHGYWPNDWFRLNRHFTASGESEPLEAVAPLVAAAHRHGMEVYIDTLIHHGPPRSMPGGAIIYKDGQRLFDFEEDRRRADRTFDGDPDAFRRFMDEGLSYAPLGFTDPASAFLHTPQTTHYDQPFPLELEAGTLIDLAKLNPYNPRVKEMLFEAYRRLLEVSGARGMRIDSIKHMFPWFIEEFVAFMKEHFPGLEAVGEYFHFSWLIDNVPLVELTRSLGLGYFDFALQNLVGNAFLDPTMLNKEHSTASTRMPRYPLLRQIADYIALMTRSPEIYAMALRNYLFLDNHDLPRFMNADRQDTHVHEPGHKPLHPERHAQDQALLLLAMMPGRLSFFYGQEKYLRGPDRMGFWGYASDPENRPAFGRIPSENHPGVRWMKRLTALRHKNPALTAGNIEVMPDSGETRLSIKRRFMGNEVFYWHDRSHAYNKGHRIQLGWPDGTYRDPMTGRSYTVRGGTLGIPEVPKSTPRPGAKDAAYRTIVLTLGSTE